MVKVLGGCFLTRSSDFLESCCLVVTDQEVVSHITPHETKKGYPLLPAFMLS